MNRKNSKPSTTITFALLLVLVALLFVTFLPPAYAGGNVAVTRTFQPSTADTYIRCRLSDENMGADPSMEVQSYNPSSRNNRVLVQFDFSQIPTGSTDISATLSLYAYAVPGSTRTYDGHRVTQAWTEGTGTTATPTENGVTWDTYNGTNSWTTAGGDYAATSFNANTGAVVGWMDFTVTNDVAGFVAGTYTNYGWLIKDTTEDSGDLYETLFRTKEATETTHHPKLTVTYTAPWDSHKTSYTGPICETFSDYGTEHTVYMHGTGFKAGSYNVVYWDGDGYKRVIDAKSVDTGGILDSEHTFLAGTDLAGTWYASAYVGDTPAAHSDTTDLWADDSFTVEQSAIPEFPTVIAAIAVCLLCAVAYVVMRRRTGRGDG